MNDNEMNLLFKKAWGTITEEDFQNQFTKKLNSDYVVSELDNIIEEKSRDKLEAILSYMYLIEEVSLLCFSCRINGFGELSYDVIFIMRH